ncbi:uncharacterized protein SPEM2 [Tenrec ecaudatus]|uniref:uncharacterized protein SPEM2 n=1 Tax=Tenrec ecaudatus TaxID=94439 RepID=UPI003F5A330E
MGDHPYDALGCCNQYQESPQDTEDFLLLLLGLIILVNIGVNMAIVMWHRFRNVLDKIFWINQKNAFQSDPNSPEDPCQSPARDVHIHCTLDPVEVKMTQSTHCSSSSYHLGNHLHNTPLCRRRRQRRRRSRNHHFHGRHHCSHQQRPVSYRPFPHGHPVFSGLHHRHQPPPLQPRPCLGREDQDYYPEDNNEEDRPHPMHPPGGWRGLYPRLGLPSRPGLWSQQNRILASLPPPSVYMSPELRRIPKRVEAKSELRLQTFGPRCSQSHVWGNVEAEHWASTPQPTCRLPPPPAWVPGGHSPQPSRGHLIYDSWEQRRRGLDCPEPPPLVPRSSTRPEAQGYRDHYSPQSHRRAHPSHAYSQPNRSPHPSSGHLPYSAREPHEARRRVAEWTETLPGRHLLTTSTSLTMLGEASCHRGPAPGSTLLHHSSQPLSVAQAEPAPTPTTFIPLSRSPGGNTNYQVYDSLELKRQVQEGRVRASSLPPPSTSASRPSLHHSRAGRLS